MRHSALWKDAWRAISGNRKRFIAIAVICAIGIMMLNGLNAVGTDIRGGLDDFFDDVNMHDASVVSSLGLDDGDIAALQGIEGVEKAAGVHAQNMYTVVQGRKKAALVTALNGQGIDRPDLREGRMPKAAYDVVVTRQYLDDSGKRLGQTLDFTVDTVAGQSGPAIAAGRYRIVGVVADPTDIVDPNGPLAMASGSRKVYPLFVAGKAVAAGSPYTSAVVTFTGASALGTFDDDYLSLVSRGIDHLKAIEHDREFARTQAVKSKALEPIEAQEAKLSGLPDGLPQKTVAIQRLAQARAKVDSMKSAQWHIVDRSALPSYADVKSQSALILKVGELFPVLFLVIAVLVGLTAIARMVEEDRQLIGTYKALGYRRGEVMTKYVLYSLLACLTGGVVGDLLGIVGLPLVFTRKIVKRLYMLPGYPLKVNWWLGLGGVLLFVVAIVGSAVAVSVGQLRKNPAMLMLPKAPKPGKTIILQRIPSVWSRLSFLDKVTARNLFRYKSRTAMVVIGVFGCTSLMTVGFGLTSSAFTLMPRQNAQVTTYDVLAVTSDADYAGSRSRLKADDQVQGLRSVRLEAGTLSTADAKASGGLSTQVSTQMLVVPRGQTLSGYVNVVSDGHSREPLRLGGSGVVVTRNAAQDLGLHVGDRVELENAAMETTETRVTGVALSYTGNYVFMSQKAYEKLYGVFHANAELMKIRGGNDNAIDFANRLGRQDAYLSVVSNAKTARDFTKSFMILFVIIGFIVVMAAALAIVVLYTLATTNIEERRRELATIKVLGFRNREVHGYVNKELAVLSVTGTVIGLPCGYWLLTFLLGMLVMPGMTIVPNVRWFCYVAAAALSLVFTWLVTRITNRSLDRIDMVAALKSPE